MYKKGVSLGELENVKVEVPRSKRKENNPEPSYDRRLRDKSRSSRNSEFVYVNNAYVGSLSSVNEVRTEAPPTSVIREQYWACSKWPVAQRFLAIAVGILLGAVIGLVATLVVRAAAPEVDIGGIFRSSAPD